MEKVTTASGKSFDCDYFNPFPPTRQANLRVCNDTIANVASVFSNPAETVQLWCGNQYAANYTRLVAIIPEENAVRVVLEKE